MNASPELEADYLEWQRLAEAEGEAIRSGDWIYACDCQNALKQLQPRIISHTARAQMDGPAHGPARLEQEEKFRTIVRQLIELEQRNFQLLDSRIRSAHAELDKLQHANFTLHRIQRSYAPARPAVWNSFS